MRVLHRLAGRVAVWPFDAAPPRGPLIVEIYTSLAARDAGRPKGRSKMTTIAALNAALTNPAIGRAPVPGDGAIDDHRSEEHTSELQSPMRNPYAVFCLKK